MAGDSPEIQTKKRKRSTDVEEIEIDVSAPEPPSKKALRRAKKHSKSQSHDDTKDGSENKPTTQTAETETSQKRSPHGVWIGNLSFTTSKDDIQQFIISNSTVTESMITRIHLPTIADPEGKRAHFPKNKQTLNKGFAYVDFDSEAGTKEAIGLSEKLLAGRRLLIKDAKSYVGRPKTTADGSAHGNLKSEKPPSKRIFVGNLAFDITKEDLEEHFSQCGKLHNVHMATFQDSGKCKGFAWIEFEELEASEAAVRGWILVKQESSDLSDSDDDEKTENEEEDSPNKNNKRSKPKKPRKWFVNRLNGRPLRMEFAEDKAVRYQKRYGKNGTAKATSTQGENETATTTPNPQDSSTSISQYQNRDTTGSERPTRKANEETMYRTGAIVEGTGKKTVFT
ncbi:MAG: hypothetical protein M1834_001263 [Cirrosporium novae-zelandiae]|nr:MAG: hypothetical protein M1834_001263 [Cirrosporium novae-zelandiae]